MAWLDPIADTSTPQFMLRPTPIILVNKQGNYAGPDGTNNTTAINDGVNALTKATVTQLHNADRQNPGPTAFGLLVGSTSGIVTPDGLLSRQTETGFDGIGSGGVTTGAQQFAQQFLTIALQGSTIAAGTASAIIQTALPAGMIYKNALTIDSGVNTEQVMISAVTVSGITVVPLNGAPTAPAFKFNHVGPFNVTGFIWNQERDANGELWAPRGQGMAVALPYLGLSTGQGITNPIMATREVGVQGLGVGPLSPITSGFTQGSLGGVLASVPVNLGPGMPLYLVGPGTSYERVITALNYVAGSTTILLDPSTPVQGIGRTSAQAMIFQAALSSTLFYPEGEGGEFELVADFTSGKGAFVQNAGVNNAPYQNSPLEAPGLDNGAGLDRAAANQNSGLITAVNANTLQVSPDQTNVSARGVTVVLNLTTTNGNVTLQIQGKDIFAGYYPLFTANPVTSTGLYVYTLYPGIGATAGVSANLQLPRTWRVIVTPNNGNPCSYTVGASTTI